MKIPISPRLAQIVAKPYFEGFDYYFKHEVLRLRKYALKNKAQALIAHDRALHGREL